MCVRGERFHRMVCAAVSFGNNKYGCFLTKLLRFTTPTEQVGLCVDNKSFSISTALFLAAFIFSPVENK